MTSAETESCFFAWLHLVLCRHAWYCKEDLPIPHHAAWLYLRERAPGSPVQPGAVPAQPLISTSASRCSLTQPTCGERFTELLAFSQIPECCLNVMTVFFVPETSS